jgi:hypothetical protein
VAELRKELAPKRSGTRSTTFHEDHGGGSRPTAHRAMGADIVEAVPPFVGMVKPRHEAPDRMSESPVTGEHRSYPGATTRRFRKAATTTR